jgi:DNA polymerase-3 subunit delta'
VLVAVQPSRLPATILSRCQRIRVRAPTRTQSLEWLREVRGERAWESVLDLIGEAPLAAASLDPRLVAELRRETQQVLQEAVAGRTDPVDTAERWSRTELPLRLACIENWLTERIRRSLGVPAHAAEVRSGAHRRAGDSVMNTRALFQRLEQVRELRAALATPINRSLALESLLRSLQTSHGPQ